MALIQTANLSHISEMVQLLKHLFNIEADFDFDATKHHQGIQHIIDDSRGEYLIATINNNVIGMCCAQWLYSSAEGGKSAWIEDMVVHPDYQQQGIGKQLLNGILDWCIEHDCVRAQLVYDMNNDKAIGYYQHQQWQQTELGVFKKPLK